MSQTCVSIMKEEVEKAEDTVNNLPPEILINTILLDAVELEVLGWITNIYAEAAFKSRLLNQLLIRFREKEIKVM